MKKIIAITLFIFTNIQAQQSIVSSGGDAMGSGGAVSYSVGQIVYTKNTGSTGSGAQGVQQPYEISVVVGIDEAHGIRLMTVFPNPTTNLVVVIVENFEVTNLTFQLFDTNGRLIENKKIVVEDTTIDLNGYPATIYFLQVLDKNKVIKTFKIIKN